MLNYLLRRIALFVPTLLGMLAIMFFIMANSPGGLGNVQANKAGGMNQGEDTRRQIRLMERYYALDETQIVQFGRWLNNVSPLGFRMSSETKWAEQTEQQIEDVFRDAPFVRREADLKSAVNLVCYLAAFTQEDVMEIAKEVRQLIDTPEAQDLVVMARKVGLEAADFTTGGTEGLEDKLTKLLERGSIADAQAELLKEAGLEVQGRDRILFSHGPKFKAPDLGQSFRGRKVGSMVLEHLPATMGLNMMAIPIIYILAIVSGVYAARHKGSVFDWGVGTLTLALWSLPVMFVGMVLMKSLASDNGLLMFPANGLHDVNAQHMPFWPSFSGGFERGWLLDMIWHMVLPVACLSYGGLAVMSKVMRSSLLEQLSADFVRTAHAKGLPDNVVLWRHAVRNTAMPLITMLSGIIPALFAGSFIVESIFGINGMGKLGLEAARQKDPSILLGILLMGGLIKLTVELLRDTCYAIADPRVSYE